METQIKDENWVTTEQVEFERGFYSDIYKNENGFRPRDLTNSELADWLNNNFKLDGKMIVEK